MLRLSTWGPRRIPFPVVMPQSPNVTISGDFTGLHSVSIDILNKERIIIRPTFYSMDSTLFFKLAFFDISSTFIGFTDPLLSLSYSHSDLNNTYMYSGQLILIANEIGAASFKLYILEQPQNEVQCYIGSS